MIGVAVVGIALMAPLGADVADAEAAYASVPWWGSYDENRLREMYSATDLTTED